MVFVEHAWVEVHSAEKRSFYVLSLIPPGAITGIHIPIIGRLYQTPGLQLMHPISSNSTQSPHFAILGNGSGKGSCHGNQNRMAKQNLQATIDQSLLSNDCRYHDKVVGQVGQANFVIQYDVDQTLRTYVDCATAGADTHKAYSTANIIQERNT